MKIVDFHIYRYSLPFVHPIHMLNHTLKTRDGLLVKLQTADGLNAFGDVPPFPGLSDESIELAFIQLADVCEALKGHKNPVTATSHHRISTLFPGLYPSVAFGVESALIDLTAQAAEKSLADFFSIKTHRLQSNGLVTGPLEDMPKRAKQRVENGYTHLKIKVGRDDLKNEIDMLHRLSDLIGKEIKLRLDANRAWDISDAIQFCHAINDLTLDYIEEPLANSSKIAEFYNETHIPVALDESLTAEWLETPPAGVAAFIIKPGIHGGVFESIRLIKKAQQHRIQPVISSAFLSAVGLKSAAFLAAAVVSPTDVMGLDTSSCLATDFTTSPLSLTRGQIDLLDLDQKICIHPELLQEIR